MGYFMVYTLQSLIDNVFDEVGDKFLRRMFQSLPGD